MLKLNKSSSGFTLIELLVVIAIIGILVTVLLVSFSQVQKRSRDTDRSSDLQEIASALQKFYSDNSRYPVSDANGNIRLTTGNCLNAGGDALTWGVDGIACGSPTKTYLRQLPKSPSGADYCYEHEVVGSTAQRYRLYAQMEGQGNLPATENCGGQNYNYRLTSND